MPINISSFLVPSGGNSFFLLEDKHVRGGFRVAADNVELMAIPTLNLKEGCLAVRQDNVEQVYRYDGEDEDGHIWTPVSFGGGMGVPYPITELTSNGTLGPSDVNTFVRVNSNSDIEMQLDLDISIGESFLISGIGSGNVDLLGGQEPIRLKGQNWITRVTRTEEGFAADHNERRVGLIISWNPESISVPDTDSTAELTVEKVGLSATSVYLTTDVTGNDTALLDQHYLLSGAQSNSQGESMLVWQDGDTSARVLGIELAGQGLERNVERFATITINGPGTNGTQTATVTFLASDLAALCAEIADNVANITTQSMSASSEQSPTFVLDWNTEPIVYLYRELSFDADFGAYDMVFNFNSSSLPSDEDLVCKEFRISVNSLANKWRYADIELNHYPPLLGRANPFASRSSQTDEYMYITLRLVAADGAATFVSCTVDSSRPSSWDPLYSECCQTAFVYTRSSDSVKLTAVNDMPELGDVALYNVDVDLSQAMLGEDPICAFKTPLVTGSLEEVTVELTLDNLPTEGCRLIVVPYRRESGAGPTVVHLQVANFPDEYQATVEAADIDFERTGYFGAWVTFNFEGIESVVYSYTSKVTALA